MDLREWLILGGALLVALILFDGWRRISGRRRRLKLDIDSSLSGIGEADGHNPELPNGGARVKSHLDEELPQDEAELPNSPELDAAVAEMNADLDREASMLSGLSASRDGSEVSAPTDTGDFISTPRVADVAPAEAKRLTEGKPVIGGAHLSAGQPQSDAPQDAEFEPASFSATAPVPVEQSVTEPQPEPYLDPQASNADLAETTSDDRVSNAQSEQPEQELEQPEQESEPVPADQTIAETEPVTSATIEAAPQQDEELQRYEEPQLSEEPQPDKEPQLDEEPHLDEQPQPNEAAETSEESEIEVEQTLDEPVQESETAAQTEPAEVAEVAEEPHAQQESEPSQAPEAGPEQPSKSNKETPLEPQIGEMEDLFAIPDLDFDRPIHEILDMESDDEATQVPQTTLEPLVELDTEDASEQQQTAPKPKPRKAKKSKAQKGAEQPQTDSLFDTLLDRVEEAEASEIDDIESLMPSADEPSADETDTDASEARSGQRQPRQLDFSDPELALAIFVVAPKGSALPGNAIRGLAEACGMEYGQQNLFHRFEDASDRSPIQFSMSDAVNTGQFDLDTIDDYQTPAVSLFMSLAEARDPMYAYECMLATAETFGKHLNAELLDSERSVLRNQTKEHLRERVSAYQLKQRSKRRSR